jgi:hypothetical protein
MKRVLLLVTVASMLAAAMALSGVAQAAIGGNKANAQCLAEAVRTLQPGFKPSNYTFIGGTAGNDRLDGLGSNDAPDVFCGFGGDDQIDIDADDIFLGGAGNDVVNTNYGTFYGGAGNDEVDSINYGTFYGGDGDDQIFFVNFGTFYGGAGNDYVDDNEFGTFYGGPGDDTVGSGQPPVEEP